ncbi:hypothetical protein [Alsobacter sp. R-9]
MKILYVSGGSYPDYQCDMLFHGLRGLLGPDVVDVQRVGFMYAATYANDPEAKGRLYGRGFTLFGLLGPDDDVDRDDIAAKIRAHHFDLVVYGSVFRCRDHLPEVLRHYDPRDIVFVDGEDFAEALYWPLVGRGLYFKREMLVAHGRQVEPIFFSIPKEKICESAEKTRVMAYIDPRDRGTYIYDTEEAYYADYRTSLFGVTMKKAGWDCLRHYEIMANRCVPFFLNLDACPLGTMARFPRYEIHELNAALQNGGEDYFRTVEGFDLWNEHAESMVAYLKAHLTTEALARYVLDTWTRLRA